MPQYAILCNPGHNRVFFQQAQTLALAELTLAGQHLDCGFIQTAAQSLWGVAYIVLTTELPLTRRDQEGLFRLSFAYAIFRWEGECFYPLERAVHPYCDDSLSTILKYTGKTNEMFTRMMIRIAMITGGFDSQTPISLLDPLAGKGTTLFEGLIAGCHVTGMEIGTKAVAESAAYLKKYLEKMRFKHEYQRRQHSGAHKQFTAQLHQFTLAKDKQAYSAGDVRQVIMAAGDTCHVCELFGKSKFQILIADLPYGVAHGSVTGEKQSKLTRSPDLLLQSALPGWAEALQPGGVMVLSWNTFVLSRDKLAQRLSAAGLTVYTASPYDGFAHRVDQAINRDVIVASRDKKA